MLAGNTYYFAGRSHDCGSSHVSELSNEVSTRIPEPIGNQLPNIATVFAAPAVVVDTETSRLAIVANDQGIRPQPLSYIWSVPAGAGSLSDVTSATPTYTPPDVAGVQDLTLTVHVSDGQDAATGQVRITVNDVPNQPPVGTNPGEQSGSEEDLVSLVIEAIDSDGDTLTYAVVGLPTGLIIDTQSGLISGRLGSAGTYSVLVTVRGGSEPSYADSTWVVSAAVRPTTIRAEAGLVLDVTNAEWTLVRRGDSHLCRRKCARDDRV